MTSQSSSAIWCIKGKEEIAWSVWSVRVWIQARDCKSHSLTLESLDPVTKALPLGWHTTLRTHDA